MDQAWIRRKEQELETRFQREQDRICKGIEGINHLPAPCRESLIKEIRSLKRTDQKLTWMKDTAMQEVLDLAKQEQGSLSVEDVYQIFQALSHLHMEWVLNFSKDFSRLADSKPLHFDGDVVITDPCYFMRDPAPGAKNDWSACDYGRKLDLFGIRDFYTRDTLSGDWGCQVTDPDTGKVYGSFGADSGQVCVADLSQVLSYNPDYDLADAGACVLHDFKGTIQVVVRPFWGGADLAYDEYRVQVIGDGIHKTTGQPFRFIAREEDE